MALAGGTQPGAVAGEALAAADVDAAGEAAGLEVVGIGVGGDGGCACGEEGSKGEGQGGVVHFLRLCLFCGVVIVWICLPWYEWMRCGIWDRKGNIQMVLLSYRGTMTWLQLRQRLFELVRFDKGNRCPEHPTSIETNSIERD